MGEQQGEPHGSEQQGPGFELHGDRAVGPGFKSHGGGSVGYWVRVLVAGGGRDIPSRALGGLCSQVGLGKPPLLSQRLALPLP